jgi:inorganic triphosphatase YgiF
MSVPARPATPAAPSAPTTPGKRGAARATGATAIGGAAVATGVTGATDVPRETEIKLALPAAAAARVGTLPVLRGAKRPRPATLRLLSTYFDTEDRRLARAGIALRVRRSGRRWIQAVKTDDASIGALHRRAEFESPVVDGSPALAAVPDAGLAERMLRIVGERALVPLFTVEVERRVWLVARGDAELEVVLDRGDIRAGERSAPVCELEIETRRGDVSDAFAVAREIAAALPARPSDASKFVRGMALRFPDLERPAPRPASFAPGDTPAAALGAIAGECAAMLEREREGLAVGYDSHAVHQMRVALRRLSSARRALRGVVPPPAFDEELRWLRDCLGRSRNWDIVFETALDPVAAEFPEHRGLAALVERAASERGTARAEALEAVRSPRYRVLALDLLEWTAALATAGAGEEPTIGAVAKRLVRRRWRKLRRDLGALAGMTAEERHRVRIAAKRLRYAVEFFEPLLAEDLAKRIGRLTRRLQGALGAANDVETARLHVALLGRQMPAPGPEESEALGLLHGWCAHAAKTLAAQADAAFRPR